VSSLREAVKGAAFAAATVLVSPALISFQLRARVMGRDRALAGSTQALALVPGVLGQYLRRAFLARTLVRCHPSATIEFGTIFSKAGAIIDERAYVGPRCHLGLVHLERDVLLAAGVHVPSGARTHGTDDSAMPIREQQGTLTMVRIGAGAWVGSAAVVMADVGANSIIGAGAVVTSPVPESVTAAGVPARVLRSRVAELQPAAAGQGR
jgi:acetyltransferase-like isoleucine patch superfamily enzyme